MKAKLYPVFLITGSILLSLISLKQFLLHNCVRSIQPQATKQVALSLSTPLSTTFPKTSVPVVPQPRVKPIFTPIPQIPTPISTLSGSSSTKTGQGAFRVSNQSEHPVRVALLSRSSATSTEPVHWDFAPEEGSQGGLMLSLPEGDLTLKSGDVLVVFAQDGSRYYWGPYVVGETSFPTWNPKGKEWHLVVEPFPTQEQSLVKNK